MFVLGLCCILALALAGCTKNLPKPERPQPQQLSSAQQNALTQEMSSYGSGIQSYKALGKVIIKKDDKLVLSGRSAWTAQVPDKLSLVAFAAGIPVMRMACDGKNIYYADSLRNNKKLVYYTADNTEETMDNFIGIQLSTRNMLSFWIGQVMPRGYRIIGEGADGNARVITMSNNNGEQRDVYIDRQTRQLLRIDDFTSDGGLKHSAYLENMQNISGYSIPFKIVVTSTTGTDIEFTLDQVWLNMPMDPNMFVLWPE